MQCSVSGCLTKAKQIRIISSHNLLNIFLSITAASVYLSVFLQIKIARAYPITISMPYLILTFNMVFQMSFQVELSGALFTLKMFYLQMNLVSMSFENWFCRSFVWAKRTKFQITFLGMDISLMFNKAPFCSMSIITLITLPWLFC